MNQDLIDRINVMLSSLYDLRNDVLKLIRINEEHSRGYYDVFFFLLDATCELRIIKDKVVSHEDNV